MVKLSIIYIALSLFFVLSCLFTEAQIITVQGYITCKGKIVEGATVKIINTKLGVVSDNNGFVNLQLSKPAIYNIVVTAIEYNKEIFKINVKPDSNQLLQIELT